MSRSRRPPTPDWKSILLASPDWPEDLVIPQCDALPKGSECVLESVYNSEHWEWELWRQPDGRRYFLKVWPFNEGKFGKPNTPGLALTLEETLQFLMTNWMPQEVLADLAAEAASSSDTPHPSGLN